MKNLLVRMLLLIGVGTSVLLTTATAAAAGDDDDLYLFSPMRSTETYLMNSDGQAVYTWPSDYMPGLSVYLLENGNLLRTGNVRNGGFDVAGAGGIIQEISPDGTVVWQYHYADGEVQQHHDIEVMPNGNILMIAWELKTEAEAISAGRNPGLLTDDELYPDHVVELNPVTNRIVWEWHTWDHLVQDYDSSKPNFGVVADHPELINLNHIQGRDSADWTHINSIDYNAELDQILLSVHNFSEIWIIDHDTTTAEAAGPAGDLLYRWGNPQAYAKGTAADQQLYSQHDARWIPSDYPGGDHILIFNNGSQRDRAWSSVDEIVPPLLASGTYILPSDGVYGPGSPVWTYAADSPGEFFADHISGAHRLTDGNTLITSGTDGRFFEVTSAGDVVWSYDYGGEVFRVTAIPADDPRLDNLNLEVGSVLADEAGNQQPGSQPSGPSEGSQPPNNAGRGAQNGPPRAATNACNDLSDGAQCSFQTPNGTRNGICYTVNGETVCGPGR